MKIQMPLEVWVDVFAPISRRQLAQRLNEIGSRSFANIAMFFLHEYGQIKLGQLNFGGSYGKHEMTETEMPANIKDFESIDICTQEDKIDCSLMTTFLTPLRPLLSNVNLWCNYEPHKFEVPDFPDKLLSLINSFNSIHFYDDRCFDLVQEKCVDKFFATKVISIKIKNYKLMEKNREWKPKLAILRKWLLSNGNDAENEDANILDEPRILYVDKIPKEMFRNEIDSISNEFMQSTKPTRFIARFEPDYMDEEQRQNFETIRLINQTTNEQLSAKCIAIEKKEILWGKHWFAVLHSHPIVPNGEEHEGNMLLIEKMQEKITTLTDKFVYSTNRKIDIY